MATLEPTPDNITQELYKRNSELAVRNKTLSLLGTLYEIGILTLAPVPLGERVAQTVQAGLDYDLVGLFRYEHIDDALTPLHFAKSARLEKILGENMPAFDGLTFASVSHHALFAPIFSGTAMNSTDDLAAVWDGLVPHDVLARVREEAHLRTVLFYPLLIEHRKVLGVLMIGLNRGYGELGQFEQESMRSFVNVTALALNQALLNQALQASNQNLEQMNVKLAKMDALKSEFVSMAGHQLRAPLTVIKGYISLVLDGTIKGANAAVKDALGRAMFSTEQLVKLVGSLLDLSRIESGKIKYDMAEWDLAHIVSEVIDKFKQGAEKKEIALVFENHAAARMKFSFDQDKIREAVVNYVDNAIKYSSEGGRVVVGLDVAGSGSDAKARVSVHDSGLGIKHEDIAKLFDKFSRTDEAKNYDPNGMGIGLFFAKRVVQDHGGRVGAESDGIGKGSTFWFELPMSGGLIIENG